MYASTFQAPYNVIRYEIIGDDSAPTFFSCDPDNGRITVQRDIVTDLTVDYQVTLEMVPSERDKINDNICTGIHAVVSSIKRLARLQVV